MDVKRKIAVLADTGGQTSRDVRRSQSVHFAENGRAQPPTPGQHHASATGHQPAGPGPAGSTPKDIMKLPKGKEKDTAALQLWNKWAVQALGPISGDPTAQELQAKSKRLKEVERQCAELAARTQRRLELSVQVRAGGPGTGLRSSSGNFFTRDAQWAAHEKYKASVYEAVRDLGRAERAASQSGAHSSPPPAAAPAPSKSRAMLETLLANGSLGTAPAPGKRTGSSSGRPQSASARMVPDSASNSMGGAPRQRSTSGGSVMSAGSANGKVGSVVRVMADPQAQNELKSMQQEMEALRAQLEETQVHVEMQQEMEVQLRDTIDMLRARLHAQNQRELENQRRLQMHTRLEPLFDKLAEQFTFKSPEEVVERLEFLEDDKLGAMDQLTRAQEDVLSLQHQLEDALKRVEVVRTSLTTENLQSTAKLQAQNEQLQTELELMESVVKRLEERQEQLVGLQTAVLDLWARCQQDPAFTSANAEVAHKAGGQSAGKVVDAGDTAAMLAMVQEYIINSSPKLASRQYLDIQRVANRVWGQHFQHKRNIRGKVIETFEALSNLGEMMASRIKTVQDQLARSRDNEKVLTQRLKMMEVKKRAVEAELGKKNETLRSWAGVPRKERPASASPTLYGTPGGPPSPPGSPPAPRSPTCRRSASPQPANNSLLIGELTAAALARVAAAGEGGSGPGSGLRPQSAPSARRPLSAHSMGSVSSARKIYTGGYMGGSTSRAGSVSMSRAAARPASASPGGAGSNRLQQQQQPIIVVQVNGRPSGEHWAQYETTGSAPGQAQAPGALYHAEVARKVLDRPRSAQPQGSGSGSGNVSRWIPPTRSEIESSFLSRLERNAQIS